jgi:1,4-alpha-glucan branching enzyme
VAGSFHRGIQALVRDLNRVYRERGALHEGDTAAAGFAWIEASDAASSVMAWRRIGRDDAADFLVIAANYTPVVRREYRLGVPADASAYREVLNTDARAYGGGGVGNPGRIPVEPVSAQGHAQSIALTLPPLGVVVLEPIRGAASQSRRDGRRR